MEFEWIGKGIRKYRLQKGYTIEKLSELSDVEPSSISHAENGTRLLSVDRIIKILNALEIGFEDCLANKSEKQIFVDTIQKLLCEDLSLSEMQFFNALISLFEEADGDGNFRE